MQKVNIWDIEGTEFPAGRRTRVILGQNGAMEGDKFCQGYVVVYKGSDRLLSVYTDVDEEQLVLTEMDPSWQGKRFYAKVKALGSVYDSTEDSEFGDSETFRWE